MSWDREVSKNLFVADHVYGKQGQERRGEGRVGQGGVAVFSWRWCWRPVSEGLLLLLLLLSSLVFVHSSEDRCRWNI